MRMVNPGMGRLATLAVLASLALYQTLSDALLFQLGIPYTMPTGNVLFKLHPGTYVGVLALAAALLAHGNPLATFTAALRRHPPLGVWLGSMLFLLVYSIARYGMSGAAFLIDTLIMPALIAITLLALPPSARVTAFRLIFALVFLNEFLAFVETARRQHVVLWTVAGVEPNEGELFRAVALTGHPLNGALVTGTLAPLILTFRIPTWQRAALLGITVLALLAYGGRTSFLLTLVFLGGYLMLQAFARLLRGQFSYVQITGGSLLVVLGIGALVGIVLLAGLGERIFAKMKVDDSAEVRARIWQVFDLLTPEQWVAGASPAEILDFIHQLSLADPLETIENFWINMYLQFGAIGFVPFVVAMVMLLRWLWRLAPGPSRVSILFFIVTASSNNSLSAKASMLATVVAALVCHASRRRARRLEKRERQRAVGASGSEGHLPQQSVTPRLAPLRPRTP